MTNEDLIKYINEKIDDINRQYPKTISNEQMKKFIELNIHENMSQNEIDNKKTEVDTLHDEYIARIKSRSKYLKEMQKKFNDNDYQTKNIDEIDISTLNYNQMENLFFHYSWKKYLESYDKIGIKPIIGENSDGVDSKSSIFFSKGIEGVLELWDVWLKWRLNRQNNPQYRGNTSDEIKATLDRYRTNNITDEERKEWYYWIDYLKEKKYLSNNEMLTKLFEYQYNEMVNSVYLLMNLKDNEEFTYNQIDEKKQKAINYSKKSGRGIDPVVSAQYGAYSDLSTPIVDKWNMQTIPGKDMTIEPSRLKKLIINGNNDVYSIIKYMYDQYKKEVSADKQVKFDILDIYIEYVEEKKRNSTEIKNEKIELTPELSEIFSNIDRDSKLSSSELAKYYLSIPEYQQMFKRMETQSNQIKEQLQQIKANNPQMSDNDFFKTIINNHSKNIIKAIKKDYGDKLTPEIVGRLDNFNISIINNPETRGDITAHPEKFQVEINEAHFATDVKNIESKIVRAMGTMPHEIFHFVYRILKDEKHCDERMIYNLVNKDQATCLGMTGHMLNEGFVEKLSTDFCKRNNIYSTINPTYIQFTKLCDHIMKTNPEVNESFLIKNNYDGILNKFSSEAKEKYKETERIEYLRNFKLKTTSGEKRKIDDHEVVSSYNESVKPKYTEQKFQQPKIENKEFTPKKQEAFTKQSQTEIQIYQQIKEKNQMIKQYKVQNQQFNKPQTRKLTQNSNRNSFSSKGFADVIILLLIVSFVCGALSIYAYIFIKG